MRIVTAGKSVQFRGVPAGFAALLILAATVFGANIATADSVWVQSYERSSQAEVCTAQPGETPWQESWGSDSSWTPSWEQWANGGKGGWTCTRSITWASTPAASGPSGRTYALGETGPGGGLVFLISGGRTYEMAPKTWGAGETGTLEICDNYSARVTGRVDPAIGAGAANTAALAADTSCISNAANAVIAYSGGGFSDWFIPSKDELNAMCNYSRNPTTPPTGVCTGAQDGTFELDPFGFSAVPYWSSSSFSDTDGAAWDQDFDSTPRQYADDQDERRPIRPIRSF